uniref:Photosynthetic NDH subcomplex B 2 n=2 Tax=Apostasia odorata TaxID=280455 RepID=A0A1S6YFX4_9ASPA|nr:hypothetical protein [Apostasia odorata]
MASLFSPHLSKPSPLPLIRASASAITVQSPPQSLEERFGRKGIKFSDSGDVPTVELTVRNGSSLRLRIPDGIVTSYKPKVYWKDEGFEEVLHTISDGVRGGSSVKGGLGLVLNDLSRDEAPWSASQWEVKDADSDSIDAVQVELRCTNGEGTLDITLVVSLYPLSMATAVIVQNIGTEPVKLNSAMLTHIRFKSRGGSAIQGLTGCSYCPQPPLPSSFGILSPSEALEPDPPGWFSSLGSSTQKKINTKTDDPEAWTVEDNLYTTLRKKLSRVYTSPPLERLKRIYRTPPSKYQTIDQGSGLGFRVIRIGGYEDIYLCSPGSSFKKYGKDYFICTGAASMLVPEILEPDSVWKAAQVIEHDNL